jgi:hypothetical protein
MKPSLLIFLVCLTAPIHGVEIEFPVLDNDVQVGTPIIGKDPDGLILGGKEGGKKFHYYHMTPELKERYGITDEDAIAFRKKFESAHTKIPPHSMTRREITESYGRPDGWNARRSTAFEAKVSDEYHVMYKNPVTFHAGYYLPRFMLTINFDESDEIYSLTVLACTHNPKKSILAPYDLREFKEGEIKSILTTFYDKSPWEKNEYGFLTKDEKFVAYPWFHDHGAQQITLFNLEKNK